MRIRFGLRTLLALFLCVGAVGGYYSNRIQRLGMERDGLDELRQSWTGVSVRNYLEQTEPPYSTTNATKQSWLDWPLTLFTKSPKQPIHAYQNTQHVTSLSLFAAETKTSPLKGCLIYTSDAADE